MLQWALRYRNLGLSIIPLKPKGKEPLIPWAEFQKRIASEEEIKGWFQKWPQMNIGIVTGAISGVVVVDLDGSEGLQQAQNLKLLSNVQSITGNGKHLWYRHPNQNVENAVRIAPGMDIRGDGGYVVVSPSISPNGRRYRWYNRGLADVSKLPAFPEQFLNVKSNIVGKSLNGMKKESGWIAKALQEMKNGNIDDTLFIICSRLRSDGYSADDARILLQPHADRAGAEDGHLDEKIQNVWERYSPRIKSSIPETLSGFSELDYRGRMGGSEIIIHSPTNPDSIKQFKQRSLEGNSSGAARLDTGYQKLDQMLQGGLKSSRLFTIAARTGVGKTNWLLGTAREICRAGKVVLLFSTEMPYGQIWERYIQALENASEFQSHKFYVCDSFAPNIEKVEEAINAIKPDVFMFDHINHVSEEVKELGSFMQGLNYLRRKYDCAGVVSAQLNRAADWVDLKTGEKVTPRMSMIKGSGTIEQASSRVLLLSETIVTPEYTEIVGNLDKNDNGLKGLVHFGLYNNPWRMEELK